jgi:hypothetical protein
VRVADPSNTLPGELETESVLQAATYQAMPVLWLDTSFEGLNLVDFDDRITNIPVNLPWAGGRMRTQLAGLVYGTCKPKLAWDESSCPPPLSIAINGPGLSPPVDEIELHADWSTPYKVRGAPAIDVETGTILFFENGVPITVQSDSDIRQKAIQALRLANAEALGIADIGPGEDLSTLNDLPVPKASGSD